MHLKIVPNKCILPQDSGRIPVCNQWSVLCVTHSRQMTILATKNELGILRNNKNKQQIMRTLKAAHEWLSSLLMSRPNADTSAVRLTSEKQATATLTLSVRLHSRCRVDGISKQTVSGHFQTDHSGTDGTCKNTFVIAHLSSEGVLKQGEQKCERNENCSPDASDYSDGAEHRPTHADAFLLHVCKRLDENINSERHEPTQTK